jgi:hypothetical protein
MFSVSAAVESLILGSSATTVCRVTSLNLDGSVRQTWDTDQRIIIDGSVDYDLTRAARRSCRLMLLNDGTLSPHDPADPFFRGERIRAELGYMIGTGTTWLPMFEGLVTQFGATMDGELAITAEDPMSALDQSLGVQTIIPEGTLARVALVALASPVLGSWDNWTFNDNSQVTPLRTWLEDDNRLEAIVTLMKDLGLEVFSDRRGELVLQPRPDPGNTAAVVEVRRFERSAGLASFLDLERSGSDQPINKVIAIGERPDAEVVRGEAQVTHYASPIHPSRIGLHVKVYRSSQIPDAGTAYTIAQQILVEEALSIDAVRGSAIPDPRLDEGDVVLIREPASGTDDQYRIEQVSHSLTGGEMSLSSTRVLPIFLTNAA